MERAGIYDNKHDLDDPSCRDFHLEQMRLCAKSLLVFRLPGGLPQCDIHSLDLWGDCIGAGVWNFESMKLLTMMHSGMYRPTAHVLHIFTKRESLGT